MRASAVLAAIAGVVHGSATSQQYSPHGFACVDPVTKAYPFCDSTLPVAERVSDFVSRLPLEEKLGLLGSYTGDPCSGIDGGAPSLGVTNVSQLIEVTGAVSSSCYVGPDSGTSYCPTVFPSPMMMAASFNRTNWRIKGAVTGVEARAFNNLRVTRIYSNHTFVDLLGFGPDLNVVIDPRNGRNGENPSECPILTGAYAVEVVRGSQEGEDPKYLLMSSALKHYAGYEEETNRFVFNDTVTGFDMLDTFLPPFAAGFVKGQSTGSMCSYNSLDGTPACASSWLLTDMVRSYWGRPDAYHTSDCGAIEDQVAKGFARNVSDASARSMKAGTDACLGTGYVMDGGIATALTEGALAEADVDAALTRMLAVRFRLGMFDAPNATVYTTYGPERINSAESRAAVLEAGAQGAVLLKNNGTVLPIDLGNAALKTIAVVGPHATSQWALLGDFYADAACPGVTTPQNRSAGCIPTVGASVANYVASPRPDVTVLVSRGVDIFSNDTTGIPAALAAVEAADVVILAVGYSNAAIEHEGADHPPGVNNNLPPLQHNFTAQVIAAAAARGVPVVMLVINAGQIALDNLPQLPAAIVEAFYPGFATPAVVAQLFGASNRWGRLPYTVYPSSFVNQIALSNMSVSAYPGRTYRYYTADVAEWEFGHGLSYSSFASSCAAITPTTVSAASNFTVGLSCTTTQTAGAIPGDEILLVFHRAGDDVRRTVGAAHPVPIRTLRDFNRVGPLATGAGASELSAFSFDPFALGLTNAAGATVLYPGTHYLDVSPRPPAAPWTVAVTVTGNGPVVLASPPPFPGKP